LRLAWRIDYPAARHAPRYCCGVMRELGYMMPPAEAANKEPMQARPTRAL